MPEKSLLQLIAEGDENAYRSFFYEWQGRLFHYIRTIIKSPQVAEEVVMDVLTKCWVGRELLPRIDNLEGFMFRIAYHRAIDFLRAASRDPKLVDLLMEQIETADAAAADNLVISKEYDEKLREAIGLLSPQRKKVYLLSREKGLSHKEIASELGLSKNTVSNHITESQRFIQQYLTEHLNLVLVFIFFYK
ncbi:RNA polymerase sigma-70 factor, ECF subfamily [Chitinophaga sp. YR573]|uniref:RNA polymerase sigma factor n=1 Tax=Chitinophaga sp. YR573 TaxID=1881040 RepID=UPI0008D6B90B|nr:sigma-70 family RNA polymerase sigma factor [Chitinophaga sp. YR573]SEW46416.1 RNA polymerase sigma-70 factor, ECF subfamily [Chitinophaga sp. YR573]